MINITQLRKQLDKEDKKLLITLGKRFDIAKKIGRYKKSAGLPPLDRKRFNEVIKTRTIWGKDLKINQKFIKDIFILIHEETLKIEK